MATNAGPKLVTGSMSYFVDAGSRRSLNTIAGGWSDLTGNRPTATFANATFSATNVGTVFFGGTNSSSATVTESFFSAGSRTFDVWVKRDQNVSSYNMVWGLYVPYLAMHSSNTFLFTYNRDDGTGDTLTYHYSTRSFANGIWCNVTCTIEYRLGITTQSKIYIDGVLDSTLNWPTATSMVINPSGSDPIHNLILGGWHSSNPNTALRGSISNFRIYERVLTDAEIAQNYYAMLPRFRPDVADRAALHLDAANRNSFTRVQDGWADLSTLQPTLLLSGAEHESKNGGVLTFAGTTGSFPTGSRATGNFTQSTEMTWDVWFNRTQSLSSGGNQFNMVFEHGSLPYLSFGTSNDASRFLFSWFTRMGTGTPPGGTQSQRTVNTSPIYTDNTWYNVTCTLQLDLAATTSTARIYVNGVLAASQTTAVGTNDQIWFNGSTLRLATFGANSQYPFKGSISNFRIYRRILTDVEILQSYNALAPRFGY